MATLMQIDSLVTGMPELIQRFRAARLKAAWDVINESAGTTGHTKRLAWANNIVSEYEYLLPSEYRLFLSNTTIQTNGISSLDDEIQYTVNSFVNIWAGV